MIIKLRCNKIKKGLKRKSEKVACPVCGKTKFKQEHDYDICKYCGWENDNYFEAGGANVLSLADYQKRYEGYINRDPKYTWRKNGYPDMTAGR